MSVPLAIAETSLICSLGPDFLNIDNSKARLDDSTGDTNADDNRHVERC
jgi:hypothetical protein